MGNYIRSLSEQINLISSDDLWIEDKAIQQLHTTAGLTDIKLAAGMPDLHPGCGATPLVRFSFRKIEFIRL